MGLFLFTLAEAFALTAALSADAFAASFAYGSSKIKIPAASVLIIDIVCSLALAVSLLSGNLLRERIPSSAANIISFGILFFLGFIKLFDGIMKSVIRKHSRFKRKIKFSMFSLKFILAVYADPVGADIDESRSISPQEAFSVAFALSLDGLAVGFGAAMGSINAAAAIACSLLVGAVAIISGGLLGNKLSGKLPFNSDWLSGATLMVLACLKL
ncbi:MAG: manganese efflux pump [Oscillospiraceae bacterium]|nr:manganese efflux pump [Oscillospiraceae bacterium]